MNTNRIERIRDFIETCDENACMSDRTGSSQSIVRLCCVEVWHLGINTITCGVDNKVPQLYATMSVVELLNLLQQVYKGHIVGNWC